MLQRYIAVLSAGLLLIFAYPPFNLYPFSWISFLPLFWCIEKTTPKLSFWKGFGVGSIFFLGTLYWIVYAVVRYGNISPLVALFLLILLVSYLAFYFGVFCYLIKKMPFFCPPLIALIWVGVEYIRGHLFTGFPWLLLGDSQYKWLIFIQVADIGGVYLLSFLIMWGNASFYYIFAKRNKKAVGNFIVFLFYFIVILLYGYNRIHFWQKETNKLQHLKLALIQGNIDQAQKWDPAFQADTIKIYTELTQEAAKESVDLVIWPETAVPFYFQDPSPLKEKILRLTRIFKIHLLTGSPAYGWINRKITYFNRAYLIDQKGEVKGYYDKVHLVPFGEYIPLRRFFPFLSAIASNIGDFTPGENITLLKLNSHPFGVLICFESIFPELSQKAVSRGAKFLVNITNDAWFGYTSAPYQHFSMLVLRAVETRRAIARAANTGFTAFIEPTGYIVKKTKLFKRNYIKWHLPLIEYKTFYVRYGNMIGIVGLLTFLGVIFLIGIRQVRFH